jgi:lipoprotein NlpI
MASPTFHASRCIEELSMRRHVLLLYSVLLLLVLVAPVGGDSAKEFLKQAADAWAAGKSDQALELVGKAISAAPDDPKAPLIRARMEDALGKYAAAAKDCRRCLQLDPTFAEAHDLLGSIEFKSGKIEESLREFDEFIRLRPTEANGHWRRGIALYYAGRYADGRDQFKGYESVDTNDVENAVWHFLCNAKLDGIAKARAAMLKIGKDRRVPMMEVYDLYAGKLKPADVLAAAEAGEATEAERKDRLFYAHLYLGLYYDVTGDRKQAVEHMSLAAGKYRSPHYMGDVASVHADILRAAPKQK